MEKYTKDEDIIIPKEKFKFLWFCLSSTRLLFIFAAILVIVGAVLETILSYFIKLVIDTISKFSEQPDVLTQELLNLFLIFVAFRVLVNFVWYGRHALWGISSPILSGYIREILFHHIKRHPISFFHDNFSGQIAHKAMTASSSGVQTIHIITHDLLYTVVIGLSSLIIFSTIHIAIAFTFLVWLLIYIPLNFYLIQKTFGITRDTEKCKSNISGKIVDVVTNINSVKSFANFQYEKNYFNNFNEEEIEKNTKRISIERDFGFFKTFVHTLLHVFFALVAYHLWSGGKISVGDFALILTMSAHLMSKLGALTENLRSLSEQSALLQESLTELLHTNDPGYFLTSQNLNTHASIRIENLNFSYAIKSNILSDINLTINSGQKLGLVGPSGAGKSTLVNLLLGLYRVQQNQIFIGNQDITKINIETIRQYISYIPQDTSLFHRSLIENIRYGQLDASDEAVIEAAKKAHAHEFICELPDGYNTLVGERGVKLSGGQRQRIAIARAILKDAPILILDEATSALDSESERLIQESLQQLMMGKTVIAIAHRLSTIAHLDRLIVMHQGTIIEDGTHNQLLKNKNLYYNLWDMQSGGFLGE